MKTKLLIIGLFTLLFSCSETEEFLEDNQIEMTTEDVVVLKSIAKDSFTGVVGTMSPFFKRSVAKNSGAVYTLEDFKYDLDSENGLFNATPEGEELVNLAYLYLMQNEVSEELETLALLNAFESMVLSEQRHGVIYTEDIDFNRAELTLYGLEDDSEFGQNITDKRSGCRWFQLGCRARAFWAWLGGSNGGTTNGTTLAGILAAIASAISIVKAF